MGWNWPVRCSVRRKTCIRTTGKDTVVMAFFPRSILKPDTSVMLGLANGAIILAIYNGTIPNITFIRTGDSHDDDVESTRKAAAWTSAAILGFMFLVTRDRNSFLIGGLVLAGTDMMVKHANGVNPGTGKLDSQHGQSITEDANIYPMPDYSDTNAMPEVDTTSESVGY